MVKLKFVDTRPMYWPKLTAYPSGISLPNKDNIINVTEGEAQSLLKIKNGNKNCFEKIIRRVKEEEVTDGSR